MSHAGLPTITSTRALVPGAVRPWQKRGPDFVRTNGRRREVAQVFVISNTRFDWFVEPNFSGRATTLEAAKAAADEALVKAGWQL